MLIALSKTSREFSEFFFALEGRGKEQFLLAYKEFFRFGSFTGRDKAFKNAPGRVDLIHKNTDWSNPLALEEELNHGDTKKLLFKTSKNDMIESVLIPMQSGWTICISSQVGCKMGCVFCETGRMGLKRSLTVEEIVAQVFYAKVSLGVAVRNIVFMGMGEPFDNYDAVTQAMRVLIDPLGFGFAGKNITVSTSGRVEEIKKFAQEKDLPIHLAVSVNAPSDEIRSKIMPVNNQWNMQALKEAMHYYSETTKRSILAEYVMMQGITDSIESACQLADYLQGLDVKINLIPYNSQRKRPFTPSNREQVDAFAECLRKKGYFVLVRSTKGDQVMAACGQLGKKTTLLEIHQQTL